MRTRDAIADEQLALRLALESGNGGCPTIPLGAYRLGWHGHPLFVNLPVPGTAADWRRAINEAWRRYQVGSLARRIWEGLPYAQRWWMYGETEAEMRRNRRRGA